MKRTAAEVITRKLASQPDQIALLAEAKEEEVLARIGMADLLRVVARLAAGKSVSATKLNSMVARLDRIDAVKNELLARSVAGEMLDLSDVEMWKPPRGG